MQLLLRGNLPLTIGGAILACIVLITVIGPFVMPYGPEDTSLMDRFKAPSVAHLAGTDAFGRDVMTRVIDGAHISLSIGLSVVIITMSLGIVIGAIAGYFPKLDNIIMRVMDAGEAFPTLLLAIALAAVLGPGVVNVVLALGIAYTPRTARIVRASVLILSQQQFVEAARASNASHLRIIAKHLIPNALAPVIVQMTFVFADAVLAEAALSFIGVGPPPPSPTWGNIIADGRSYLFSAPWISLFPGLAIFFTVLSLNLVGDGLRDQLDPRLKRLD
ncbi:ABC transporter permease [Pseudoruegeria sp. SK021]|uniref:ABC transporter permease n=1 Tax=Pseudoruegeria sp. SK021 TaxID=1933035 RepID=UPI001981A0DD|nr:ABC transporter permease [Pseudoruegeria sp. SK021]